MAFRRHNSPDMNLNDVEFGITYQICQIFDIDRGWEQLGKRLNNAHVTIYFLVRFNLFSCPF